MKTISTIKLNRVLVFLLGFFFSAGSIFAQTVVCEGDTVSLDAGSFRGTIAWEAGADGINFSAIGLNGSPATFVPTAGQHYVRGVISEGTCDPFYTDTMSLYVSPAMSVSFGAPTLTFTSCNPQLIGGANLAVSGGTSPYSYQWSPSANLTGATTSNPTFAPSAPGTYPFSVTVTDSVGCSGMASIDVDIIVTGQDSFTFTGGIQTFTVPPCVDTVFIEAWGAQGGTGATGGSNSTGGVGGLGGYASGYLAVSSGQTINLFVGGLGAAPSGGFNGGGNGGSQNAGGGGGASDVRIGGTALTNRVLTAGGGGGGGRAGCETTAVNGGTGGNGGGGAGVNGTTSPDGGGGFGGTTAAGGAAGIGCGGFLGSPGVVGTSGTGGVGGAGQSCCCFSFGSIPGGGGGGGGDIGGGGGGGGSAGTTGCSGNNKGGGGGGAGGTSSTSGVLNGTTTAGVRTGSGLIRISW